MQTLIKLKTLRNVSLAWNLPGRILAGVCQTPPPFFH